MAESMRRISVHRQSIAPGELALSDFLFLAQVRFADERQVQWEPFTPTNSVRSVEMLALQEE
jgi:hypothetical protein